MYLQAKKMFDGMANAGVGHVRAWGIARRYERYLIQQDVCTLSHEELQAAVLHMVSTRDDVVKGGLRSVLPWDFGGSVHV
jgi:hypothetical protein